MIITLTKEYHIQQDTRYFNLDIDTEGDPEETRQIIQDHFNNLGEILRRTYTCHEDLYREISPRFLNPAYHPGSHYFETHINNGFQKFCEDIDERQLQQLTNIVVRLVEERVSMVQRRLNNQISSTVTLPLPATEEVELEKIDFKSPTLLITNNGAYKMELLKAEGIESIQSMKETIYNTVMKDLKSQMHAVKSSYIRQIKKLKEKMEKEKAELFTETLTNSKDILKDWEFMEEDNELYLKYKHKIITKKVVYGEYSYNYPGETDCPEMYVTGLRVKIKPFIYEGDVKITRGNNLHFNGTKGCLGDLDGKPLFEILEQLPPALEIGNMNSALNGELEVDVYDTFLNKVKREEGEETAWSL